LNEDGTRQYRTAYIEVARKNGKSTIVAGMGLYMLFADNEIGAEVYCVAADRDQASIIYNECVQMILQAPSLAKRVKIVRSTKRIIYQGMNSVLRVLSAEHNTKHGYNPSCVLFDELHCQRERHLYDTMVTGMGTRKQPLMIAITTAGFDRNSICYEKHEYARGILDGTKFDNTFYPVLYAVDENDDWLDEKNWKKANPALGSFRDIEEMRGMANQARQIPSMQNMFRRLYLNQWTSQDVRWLNMEDWDQTAGEVYEEDLNGEICFGGLDLASTRDITALVLVFPDNDGYYDILPFFWIPADNVQERSRKDKVDYQYWIDQGYIETTPGNSIDNDYVTKRIIELHQTYNIQEIAFDPWNAIDVSNRLDNHGLQMVKFIQSMSNFASPTRDLMKLVLQEKIRHGNNPVLRWMADNMRVKQDAAGNVRPDKASSSEKIDGMVALIMGLDRGLRNVRSVYAERGILSI
jgi:phage terminase large subunit-like protein